MNRLKKGLLWQNLKLPKLEGFVALTLIGTMSTKDSGGIVFDLALKND
jgi:hypothetical protein